MADQPQDNAPAKDAETPAAAVNNGPDLTRKQFLTAATLGVGGVMGALVAIPAAGMALSPIFGKDEFEPVLLGKVDEFTAGKFIKVTMRQHADEPGSYVRKKVAFVRKNANPGDDDLAIKGQEEFSVVSNICMHLGCPVQASDSGFICPCHGGSYDADGKRMAGPPVRPLDRFLWEKRGDELWAVAQYSLTNDGLKVTHRDPGQHTSGLEKFLYPLQPSS